MSDKKLTIYVKSSPGSVGHFYKFNVNCYCGQCVMPECKKCQKCSKCNMIESLRRKDTNVLYTPENSENREAIIIAQSVKAVEKAYKAAFAAIRLCQCAPKKKTK